MDCEAHPGIWTRHVSVWRFLGWTAFTIAQLPGSSWSLCSSCLAQCAVYLVMDLPRMRRAFPENIYGRSQFPRMLNAANSQSSNGPSGLSYVQSRSMQPLPDKPFEDSDIPFDRLSQQSLPNRRRASIISEHPLWQLTAEQQIIAPRKPCERHSYATSRVRLCPSYLYKADDVCTAYHTGM